MLPLNLSSAQQTFLAELVFRLRGHRYQHACGRDISETEIGEDVFDLMLRFEHLSAQDYDQMYDKLHRSGSNT